MTSKFDIGRAVRASGLPKLAKLLMLVLLDQCDHDTATIPERFTPSLTVLARETSMARNTVQATLRELETAGWVQRRRPAVEQSRKGARTRYRLAVPVGAGATDLGRASTQTDKKVGQASTQPRSSGDLEVGRPVSKPRSHSDPSPNTNRANQSNPRARADDEIAAVIEALRKRTGKTIDQHHAELVTKHLLDGRAGIRDPMAYLTAALAKDPDPMRFVPTPSPPRYQPEEGR